VDRPAPVLRVVEYLPIALLIALCVLFTVRAEAVMRYTSATAAALYQPRLYIDAVMNSRPLPTPTNADRLGVPVPGGVR
jgi:multicomponent K+:H+ antiporter subunit D